MISWPLLGNRGFCRADSQPQRLVRVPPLQKILSLRTGDARMFWSDAADFGRRFHAFPGANLWRCQLSSSDSAAIRTHVRSLRPAVVVESW